MEHIATVSLWRNTIISQILAIREAVILCGTLLISHWQMLKLSGKGCYSLDCWGSRPLWARAAGGQPRATPGWPWQCAGSSSFWKTYDTQKQCHPPGASQTYSTSIFKELFVCFSSWLSRSCRWLPCHVQGVAPLAVTILSVNEDPVTCRFSCSTLGACSPDFKSNLDQGKTVHGSLANPRVFKMGLCGSKAASTHSKKNVCIWT